MKAKIKVLIASVLTLMLLCGCGGSGASEIEAAKTDISAKNYVSALEHLKNAANKGVGDSETVSITSNLENYLNALNAYNNGNPDAATEYLNKISEDASQYVFWDDISELKERIASDQEIADISSRIEEIKTAVANGNYTGAQNIIASIDRSKTTEAQNGELNNLTQTINTMQQQIDNAKKEAEQKTRNEMNNAYSENAGGTMYVVNCNEFITLRVSPSTSAAEITKIPLGATVGFLESASNGFYKVQYNGYDGYALAQYLTSKGTARVVNAKEFITLRSAPSTSASEIIKIPANAYVKYLGADGDFYKIEYAGKVGYGLASYLSLQ